MNLIALLIGLVVERLATQLFHLRRLRWLERVIDSGFRAAQRFDTWPALLPVLALTVFLALPVALAVFAVLVIPDDSIAFAYMLLAIVVLFFSFGPKDIGEDVDEYCKALDDSDEERIRQSALALIEGDVPEDPLERIHRVEEAVCVQANNRLFAVIFWFVLLGPLGAWVYRVTDLVRRRAVFSASRAEADDATATRVRDAAVALHGWLAWFPARLTAIGYATAGHFDAAISAWRAPTEERDASVSMQNERLLARVGVSALALNDDDENLTQRGVRGATAASKLVFRLFLIWAVVIAAMTLYGLTQ
jgi:AmpE protein